jgi:nucleotidyltransferase/DNA polymerase involved in DNA repair
VRNLGGKIGKAVVGIFPEGIEPTMGNCRSYLSLPQLSTLLGSETAQRVFDNARGIDDEEVKETAGALVKSITAFKSFFQTSIDSNEVISWVNLLATDIISRVKQDMQRNSRYPKSCTVHYVCSHKMGAEARAKIEVPRVFVFPFRRKAKRARKIFWYFGRKKQFGNARDPFSCIASACARWTLKRESTDRGIASVFRRIRI